MEKGGSWQSTLVIALKSTRKSLKKRNRLRKRWPVGKEKKMKLQTTLTGKNIPIDRQDTFIHKKHEPMKALQIEALRDLEANRDGKFDCMHREGSSG